MRLWHTSLALVAVIAVVAFAAEKEPIKVGAKAPDFSLQDTAGKTVKLSELKGKVVFIDFWATWCGPCKIVFPHTVKLANGSDVKKGDLAVLPVDIGETKAKVESFLKENDYDVTVVLDEKKAAFDKYGFSGIPSFVVVDHTGTVSWVQVGLTVDKSVDRNQLTLEKVRADTAKAIDTAIADALAKKRKAG